MIFEKLFPSKWGFLIIVLFTILFSLITKYFLIDDLYIKGDEPFMIFHCQKSFPELMEIVYSGKEPNPPLIFILLHFWIKFFGTSILATKSLPILISVFTNVFILLIGKRLQNVWMALFVVVLFNFSHLHFELSQEIKGFGLVLMLTTGSFYFYLSYLRTSKLKFLIPLILFNAALPYTHYNSALVPLFQFLTYPLFLKTHWKEVKFLFLGNIISLALFIPQIFEFLKAVPDDNFWLQKASLVDLKNVLISLSGYKKLIIVFAGLFTISPLLVFFLKRYDLLKPTFSIRIYLVFGGSFLIPIFINYIIGQYIPSFRLKYVYFTSLAIYFTIAYVIFNISFFKNTLSLIVISFTFLFLLYRFEPTKIGFENWEKAISQVKKLENKNSVIIISAPYKNHDFLYYYNNNAFKDYNNYLTYLNQNRIYPAMGLSDTSKFVNMSFNNLIFIQSHYQVVDPNRELEKYFEKNYTQCKNIDEDTDINIKKYLIKGLNCNDNY